MLMTRECAEIGNFSRMNGWETDYLQLGAGDFECHCDFYRTSTLSVTDMTTNREMAVSGVAPVGQVSMFLIGSQGSRGTFNGKELQTSEVFSLRPGSEGTFRTPPAMRLVNLQVPEERLRKALLTMSNQELDRLIPDTCRMNLTVETIEHLAGMADRVLRAVRDPSGVTSPDVWQREAEETLAQHCGVSLRTLETAFREAYDTTPVQYVKSRRLHAVRHCLLKADDPGLTLTKAANRWGLIHMGIFSREYKALFGEFPSETLRNGSF